MELEGKVEALWAKKKWENLKQKYKVSPGIIFYLKKKNSKKKNAPEKQNCLFVISSKENLEACIVHFRSQ